MLAPLPPESWWVQSRSTRTRICRVRSAAGAIAHETLSDGGGCGEGSASPVSSRAMGSRLWVFLPTYNEAGNLEQVVRATAVRSRTRPGRLAPARGRRCLSGRHRRARRPARRGAPRGRSAAPPGKEGLGKAYLAGFRHALERGADHVVVMDADFSHDPGHLPASRGRARRPRARLALRGWRRDRRLAPAAAAAEPLRFALRPHILGVRVNDLTSGFRLVGRGVLETVEPSTLAPRATSSTSS